VTFYEYFISHHSRIIKLTLEHSRIALTALIIGVILGVIIGILISIFKKLSGPVLNIANVIYTIPSLALFTLMIPLIGIGKFSAIVALVLYSQLIIIRNTYTGIVEVDQSIIDAALGLGMNTFQIMFKVKLPLAFPVIMTGVRISAVIMVASTIIANTIGAGGLGFYIFQGLSTLNTNMILAGTIPSLILANILDLILRGIEMWVKKRWLVT